MPDENPIRTPADEDRITDGAIFGMLSYSDEQRPWSVDEIARELGDHNRTVDGLARLYGAGLIHRCGDFAWASRAALAAEAIRL
jgi:hypothetical protein